MRRLFAGLLAFLTVTATLLVLPVYAAPQPAPEPVETSTEEVALGSVAAPAPAADVQEGTTDPVAGVPDTAPVLTVSRERTDEFSLVGVTWAPDPAVVDVLVQVRVRGADGVWGNWTEVGTEDPAQDAGRAGGGAAERRGGTAPLWTGPSTGVQVELVTRSGAAPTDVQLDLVDPGESAADTALETPEMGDTAGAALAMPPVFSRAQWGADEGIRKWAPQYAATIKAATLHHTADTNNYSADQVPAMMRSIYRYHTVSLGWGDIGYNVIVDKFGRLWEGRYGGLSSTVVGAHAGGFNTGTFGVSMLGNYDVVDTPQPMVDAVAAVIAWKFSLYNVNPNGTTTLTSGGTDKWPAGTAVKLPTIFGHRDTKSTACPGRYGYARLPEIRAKTAAALANAVSPIASRYNGDAALRASLGSPVGSEVSEAGVTWQVYQRGRLYHSPSTGVHVLRNGNLAKYLEAGGPAALGGPTTDELGTPDGRGVYNQFPDAAIYWSEATGSRLVHGAIRTRWASLGWEGGALGYPTTDTIGPVDGSGAMNGFQGGAIYWSAATGAQPVTGGLRGEWERRGGAAGPLGYPASPEASAGGDGFGQSFQGGGLFWSPDTGAWVVRGAIRATWDRAGTGGGPLGYPTADEVSRPDGAGFSQTFAGGAVYWSAATGGHSVVEPVLSAWTARDAEAGALGYPAGAPDTVGGTTLQAFAGGVLSVSADGTHVVSGGIRAAWEAAGGRRGLGVPTGDEEETLDGSSQSFAAGEVFRSPAGAFVVTGAIAAHHTATGGPAGRLGYPVAAMVARSGGFAQDFAGGTVLWSPASGAHTVTGGIGAYWRAAGGQAGPLGWPTTDERALSDGRGIVQSFTGGVAYWTARTGVHAVGGAILGYYRDAGYERSRLGYPTGPLVALPDGRGFGQTFEHGRVYWSPATGAHAVTGGIGTAWAQAGAERSGLGYPTADEESGDGRGVRQTFAGGWLLWSPTRGTWAVSGAILGHWKGAGAETGRLGYPVGPMTTAGGSYRQQFEGGTVTWSPSTGPRG